MSLFLPSQLAAIRAADFDYNADFLDRMAISLDEFIQADGMTAAGPSPGPLTEIAENHALLLEIIDRAKSLTTQQDQSRVVGIEQLNVRLEALQRFCQEKTGMSVEALIALRAAPDRLDAAFLNRLADAHEELLHARTRLLASGGDPNPDGIRDQYEALRGAVEDALASPVHEDPAKAEAIARLQALVEDLRELLP